MLSSSSSFQNPSAPLPSLAQTGGPQFSYTPRTHSSQKNLRFFLAIFMALALSALWIHGHDLSGLFVRFSKPTIMPTLPTGRQAGQAGALTNSISQSQRTTAAPKTPGVTLELKDDGVTTEIPSNEINIITEQAQPGDGVTRLARRALTERLKDESLSLTPQQRIYAEDFAQKTTGATVMRTGQKLSFPTELLDQAIQRAQQLSPRQLQNLSRYTAHAIF